MAPKYVLIAGTDKDKEVVANLEKENEELKSKLKATEDEKEKLEAADSYQEPGPVVKAIVAAMDEEHEKEAKASIAKLIANEDDPEKKAKLVKAMEDVFETGNGTNTNAKEDDPEKEEQTAVIATLTAKYIQPLIAKILQAKALAGASSASLEAEQKVLSAMKLPEFEALYASQEVFINQALAAQSIDGVEALSAKTIESTFVFNGASLIGKTVDVDAAREAAQL